MESTETRLKKLEVMTDNLDERIADLDVRFIQIAPVIRQKANSNVVIYLAGLISIINLLILLLKG